jgi:hypothetical protein
MKAIKKNKKVLIVVAVLSVIALSLSLVSSSGLASSSLFSSFWPSTPTDPIRNRTATPNRLTVEANGTLYANCCPSSTPLIISRTIDLSPNLPDYEKYIVVIARSDGTVDKFFIGPIRTVTQTMDIMPMPPELVAQLNLQPGDTVIYTSAFRFEKTWPIILTPTAHATQTEITHTIPTFISSNMTTPTIYPYPVNQSDTITPTPFQYP